MEGDFSNAVTNSSRRGTGRRARVFSSSFPHLCSLIPGRGVTPPANTLLELTDPSTSDSSWQHITSLKIQPRSSKNVQLIVRKVNSHCCPSVLVVEEDRPQHPLSSLQGTWPWLWAWEGGLSITAGSEGCSSERTCHSLDLVHKSTSSSPSPEQ